MKTSRITSNGIVIGRLTQQLPKCKPLQYKLLTFDTFSNV